MNNGIFKKWWFWVIIVVVLAIIVFSSGGNDSATNDGGVSNSPSTTTTTTTNSSSTNKVYKVGDSVSANNLKITYQSSEEWTGYNQYMGPKDGYKIIRAYFVIENIGSVDYSSGSAYFNCYADGAAVNAYYYSDEAMASIQTISAGRRIEGYVYFEVPTNASEIEIEFEPNVLSSKKIVFIVD